MKKTWQLVRATHPEPVLAVSLGVGVLALAAGKGWWAGVAFAAVLAGQLFTGWVNDYVDRDRDALAGRTAKPLVAGTVSERSVRIAMVVSGVLVVPLSLAYGLVAGLLHLVAAALAGAYNVGLKATPLSVAPYALAFGLVPLFVTLGGPHGHVPPWWLPVAAGALGAGAHFVQVLPDIESDRRLGLRGLPDLAGRRGSLAAAAALTGGAVALIGLEGKAELVFTLLEAVVLVGVIWSGLAGRDRLAFRLTLAAAGLAAVLFLREGTALR